MAPDADYKLRQVSNKDELLNLAHRIKSDFPQSVTTYNALLMNFRGQNTCYQYSFYVPSGYSDSHIVIWRKTAGHCHMSIHCTEDEAPILIKIIQDDNEFMSINRGNPIRIHSIPDCLVTPVLDVLQSKIDQPLKKRLNLTYVYSLQNHSLSNPIGMEVQKLNKSGNQKMVRKHHYVRDEAFDVQYKFTTKVPAAGVYLSPASEAETPINMYDLQSPDPDKVPVAWVTAKDVGSIGMLMTDESFQRKGLASLLMEVISRLMLVEGLVPHAHVEETNAPSIAMFQKLPGWKFTHNRWEICQEGEYEKKD